MSKSKTEIKATAIADEVLANKIYEFRGQNVMLDSDLAELYEVETKVLKQTVRRNIDRFPEDFMFELDESEFKFLRSQIVTLNKRGTHSKYLPNVFTEQGIAMLSSVLRSPQAIQVNIQIMRVFTRIRQMVADYTTLQLEIAEIKYAVEKISKRQDGQDKNVELIFEYIDRLQEKLEKPAPIERK